MERLQVVLGILIDAENRLLLAQRPEPKFKAGYWEFPGGKIEPNENPSQALQRELYEELGVQIAVEDFQFLCTFTNYYDELIVDVQAYYTFIWQGIPQGCEGQQVRFFKASDFPTDYLLPGIDTCLDHLSLLYPFLSR
jgi:8-oxo-dGTP diphosphatase